MILDNVKIRDMQTLCIDMEDVYITVVYAGTVDRIKHFILSMMSITEGGADLKSTLHTLDEIKIRLGDIMLGRENQIIDEYLKFK